VNCKSTFHTRANYVADMFRALLKTNLPKEHIFAVTVGASSKRTLATWHLLAPSDVISSIAALNRPQNEEESETDGRTMP
jgi:hypothetical protein